MKFEKINQDVLKRMVKEKEVLWDKDEDWYYILSDDKGAVFKIHKCLWFLDLESDGPSRNMVRRFNGAKKFFELGNDDRLLKYNGEIKLHPANNKIQLVVLETDAGEKIYIQQRFLALLDRNLRFYGSGPRSLVHIYEGEHPVAAILPVVLKK